MARKHQLFVDAPGSSPGARVVPGAFSQPERIGEGELAEADHKAEESYCRFLDLVRALPVDGLTKRRLIEAVWQTLQHMAEIHHLAADDAARVLSSLLEKIGQDDSELARRGKGPRERRDRVQRRNAVLRSALEQGLEKPYDHVLEQCRDEMRAGVDKKTGLTRYTSKRQMMTQFKNESEENRALVADYERRRRTRRKK